MLNHRIVFATCDRLPEATPSDQVLQRALEERGVEVSVLPWSSIASNTLADLVLLRSTWDYHKRTQEFRTWLVGLESAGRRVLNPVSTVLWNLDKAYLRELATQGIAIPETRFEYHLTPARLEALMATMGWSHAVVKPRISATAYGTFLVRAGELVDSLAPAWESGALVQAYVKEVTEQGELSLMFFGGEYSHAVSKKPKPGDFRVQSDFGGSQELVLPSEAAVQFASRVLDATPYPWTYARVDIVETAGGPLLMELELIEPHLFFDVEPRSAGRLADQLASTV